MNPSSRLFRSRTMHSRRGSLPAPSETPVLADAPTDSHLSEQALALVWRKPSSVASDDHAYASEQTEDEEEFEEITYDELRLSICPADPAHFAPVFGERTCCPCLEQLQIGAAHRLPARLRPFPPHPLAHVPCTPAKALSSFPEEVSRSPHPLAPPRVHQPRARSRASACCRPKAFLRFV